MSKEKKNKEKDPGTEPETEQVTADVSPEPAPVKTDEDMKDKFLRLAADFDNFKKRSRAEKDAVYGMAVADTVSRFLPVTDDMERALAAAGPEDTPLKKGMEQIYAKFTSILDSLGVKSVGEKGEKFSVDLHEAVMQGPSDEYEEGCVAEVFQKGYKLGDKVVRYAKVKVVSE